MHLTKLQLTHFRNHRDTTLHFSPGITVIRGLNAQGKTNIVEAIYYLTLGKSHRTSNNKALIHTDAQNAVVRAEVMRDHGDPLVVAVEFGARRRFAVHDKVVQSSRDCIGRVRSVLLASEDLRLIRGTPSERRTYLDDTASVRRARYGEILRTAETALKQRNAMLKDETVFDQHVFNEITKIWLNSASLIVAARIALVHALQREITDIYTDLIEESPVHDTKRLPKVGYEIKNGETIFGDPTKGLPQSSEIAEMLSALLNQTRDEERRRRMTVIGPHRDDLYIGLADLSAKDYASHGEQWSLGLALKLAAGLLIAETGDAPILLLDDVFADLDDFRRARLINRCTQFEQVIITMATDLPLVERYPHIEIHNGSVVCN